MSVPHPDSSPIPDWSALASALTLRSEPFIGGEAVPSTAKERFAVTSPATAQVLCELPVGTSADVDLAVQAARQAFKGAWREIGPAERRRLLLRLAEMVAAHADELALLDCLDIGKPITNARNEIAIGTGLLTYFAEAIDKLAGARVCSDANVMAFTQFEPRGVVGAIVGWNFPLLNAIVKLAPALAAGNTVVLKPSEVASLSTLRLAELVIEAGFPVGIVNVIPGLGTTVGEAIGLHPDIDFVSFTGSTAVGRRIMGCAAQSNGKPVMLELGGKSPSIVSADMDDAIEPLADRIVHDAFWNQGQWCAARTRVIVEQSIYPRLVDAVVAAAARLVPGEPLDPATSFGTIASQVQFDRIAAHLEAGRSEGARVVLDGKRGAPCALSMAPTIFGEVGPDMRIARDEIFGPVLCMMCFTDFEEAITLANATDYGLGATIWTRDMARASRGVRAINAGKILVKGDPRATGGSGLALGGEPWGASGFGVERGLEGLRSFYRVKAVEYLS